MSRLTKRYKSGIVTLDADVFMETQETIDREIQNCYPAKTAVERLAEYEDAEEKGLILRLPCKVGDTVYYINIVPHIALYQNTIYKAEVARIVPTHLGTSILIQIHNDYACTAIPNINDIAKTVFRTREEAEVALKARDGKNG